MTEWEKKIQDKIVKVGILGLGYVGLPLAREFANAGITVLGFDIDVSKIKILNSGKSIIKHVPDAQVKKLHRAVNLAQQVTCPVLKKLMLF